MEPSVGESCSHLSVFLYSMSKYIQIKSFLELLEKEIIYRPII